MATYGYCRVSTALQVNEGESLDVQRRQLEGYAMQHGWKLDSIFREEGISGSIALTKRPQGAALMATLKPGDVVIAAKLDRVFRSALDALQMIGELQQRRVSLHLLDLGGDVSGNGLSKLFLTVAAAFAEAERDRIKERVAQVKQDQRRRGRYLGGRPPYGYQIGEDGGLEPVPAQQEAIRHARELRAAETPLRAIQAALKEQYGERISLDALARLLRNPSAPQTHSVSTALARNRSEPDGPEDEVDTELGF